MVRTENPNHSGTTEPARDVPVGTLVSRSQVPNMRRRHWPIVIVSLAVGALVWPATSSGVDRNELSGKSPGAASASTKPTSGNSAEFQTAMSVDEVDNDAEWFAALGSILAALAAIGIASAGAIRRHVRRPELELTHQGNLGIDLMTVLGSDHLISHWLQLQVRNSEGRLAAEDVEVFLVSVTRRSDNMRWPLNSMQLNWSNIGPKPVLVPDGITRNVDLAACFHSSSKFSKGTTGMPAPLQLQVSPEPSGNRECLDREVYDLEIVVAAKNAATKKYTATLNYQGDYNALDSVFWKDVSLRIPSDPQGKPLNRKEKVRTLITAFFVTSRHDANPASLTGALVLSTFLAALVVGGWCGWNSSAALAALGTLGLALTFGILVFRGFTFASFAGLAVATYVIATRVDFFQDHSWVLAVFAAYLCGLVLLARWLRWKRP